MKALTTKHNRPKTFEAACKLTGQNPKARKYTTGDKRVRAFIRLSLIAFAIRGEEAPSFKDTNTLKWYARHYYSVGVGFRFWTSYYVYGDARAPGGSALCFLEKADADFFGQQFITEFEPFYS